MNADDLDLLTSIAERTTVVDGSVESAEQALVDIRESVRRALLKENVGLVMPQDDGCPGCHVEFEDSASVPPVCPNCDRTLVTVGER